MDTKLRPVPGRERKPLDMKYVYEEIGKGRSVSAIARELNVSRATIYRRHKEH